MNRVARAARIFAHTFANNDVKSTKFEGFFYGNTSIQMRIFHFLLLWNLSYNFIFKTYDTANFNFCGYVFVATGVVDLKVPNNFMVSAFN